MANATRNSTRGSDAASYMTMDDGIGTAIYRIDRLPEKGIYGAPKSYGRRVSAHETDTFLAEAMDRLRTLLATARKILTRHVDVEETRARKMHSNSSIRNSHSSFIKLASKVCDGVTTFESAITFESATTRTDDIDGHVAVEVSHTCGFIYHAIGAISECLAECILFESNGLEERLTNVKSREAQYEPAAHREQKDFPKPMIIPASIAAINSSFYQEIEALLWGMNKKKIDVCEAQRLLNTYSMGHKDAVVQGFKAFLLYNSARAIGHGAERSEEKSLMCWEKAREYGLVSRADSGCKWSQYLVSEMCHGGGGHPRPSDFEKMVKYAKLAASQGLKIAQAFLADLQLYRYGLLIDDNHAVAYLKESLLSGNAYATYVLGLCYFVPWSSKRDFRIAFRMFRLSADQGYALAHQSVGESYRKGLGIPKDPSKALHHYTMAAYHGCPEGSYTFGLVFEQGLCDLEKNMSVSHMFYKLAADNGSTISQVVCGRLYCDPAKYGLDCPPDYTRSLRYFLMAANGSFDGCCDAGKLLLNGWNNMLDHGAAKRVMTKFENCQTAFGELEHVVEWCKLMGFMYHHGLLIHPNRTKAVQHYTTAAENLDSPSPLALFRLVSEMHNKNLSAATKLLEKLTGQDAHIAKAYLGRLYLRGDGVEKDLSLCQKHFFKAKEAFSADAKVFDLFK